MTPQSISERHRRLMRRSIPWVVAVTAWGVLVGCSPDTYGGAESSAAASSSPPDVCASADALRSSLSALADVQVVQEGSDALDEAWTRVEDDWSQLADDAGDQYAEQVDGVQADADSVQTAVDAATANPSAQTLGAAAGAVGVFLQNASALVDEVRSTC
jgi:hypothetical protein